MFRNGNTALKAVGGLALSPAARALAERLAGVSPGPPASAR